MTTKAAVSRETTRLPSHILMRSAADCLRRGAVAAGTSIAGPVMTGAATSKGAVGGTPTGARIGGTITCASGPGFVVSSISFGIIRCRVRGSGWSVLLRSVSGGAGVPDGRIRGRITAADTTSGRFPNVEANPDSLHCVRAAPDALGAILRPGWRRPCVYRNCSGEGRETAAHSQAGCAVGCERWARPDQSLHTGREDSGSAASATLLLLLLAVDGA